MDDSYPYGLLVELQEDHHHVPRLKNKLLKHFQSKKRADGGECQIQYEDGSRTATLYFRREEDRARVLAKESHEVILEKGLIKVTVRLPGGPQLTTTANNKETNSDGRAAEDEVQVETASREEQTEEPALCSTSAVIENIPQDMSKEFMENLVENICKNFKSPMSTEQEFSLEILSNMCSAVVTFSSGKENNEFITSCQTNRIFLKKNLSVRPLEATTKVKVEDVSNINTDLLLLYFENEGWEVEQVTPDEEEKSAIISFKMPAAVQGIIKKKHIITKKHVKVFPFYDSLGMALYGKDQPTLKLPAPFSQTIDPTMLMYLHKKQEAAETVCSYLSALFCKVDLLPSSVSFSPLPTLLQQKDIKAKDIKEWKHSVEQAFKQALSKFKTLRLQPPLSAWEVSEAQIREMVLNKAVEVIPDKGEGSLSVIGFVEDVIRLEPSLNELLSRIEKRVLRENTKTEHKFEISKVVYQLLCQDGLFNQLIGKYPGMKIEFQDKMTINGLPDEIYDSANMVIQKALSVKQRTLVLDNTLSQFLKDEDGGNLTNVLTSNGIHAAVERVGTALNILALSDIILKNAEDQLKQVLISRCIDVDDCNILKTVQWQNLVKDLEGSTNTASKKIVITTSNAHQLERVTVVGYKDSVMPIFKEIQEHLLKYSQVNETLPVQHDVILRYIETQSNSLSDEVKDKVDISYGKKSVIFRGPREDVTKCKHKFDTLISSLYFEEYQLAKPGAKEFFQVNAAMYGSTLMKNTGCIVQLVDESAIGQNDLHPKFGNQGSSYSQHSGLDQQTTTPLETNAGLSIQLVEGNIQDATTQVVVNVVGQDLVLEKGAISKAILGAAGPNLQVLLTENGRTGNFGDVIVTNGCNLKSNMIFHAVVPNWKNPGYAQKIMTGIVQDCLNEAERRGLTSITFPAIGTGNLGFPKDVAASVMIEEFLKFKKQSMSLKTVVIVLYPKDRKTIQVFNDELKKRLSTTSSIPAPTPTQSKQGLFSRVTTASGKHEMTIRHVKVEVVLGDITKETTDVIVNSSNPSFNLKSGVSKAILDAAGPTVENECNILGAQPNTGMIMTMPGNLKCQRILHLTGHSDPQDIQQAMHDALVLVEQNAYTSISFPALGTGEGNAKADQVADAMLDAVVDMVAQSAQSCLKVVRIIIFKPDMMKDFLSRMEKRAASDKKKIGVFGTIKAFFGFDNTQKHALDAPPIESACFHICGSSLANVHQAKTWITLLIDKEQGKSTITNKAVLNLCKANVRHIYDIQKTMNVIVKIKDDSITIEGFNKNVLEAASEIQDMLGNIRDDMEIRQILDTIDWQYKFEGLQFQSIDPTSSFLLEQAHIKNQPRVDADIQGQMYKVFIPKGPAVDVQGNTLQIRRYDKQKDDAINLPSHWEPIPSGTQCHVVPIQQQTAEYNEVLQLFSATCKNTVIKIERIQTAGMWKSLQIKKQDMESRNGHKNNERRLFHGACHTTIDAINEYGFNRSFAGKNATYFGKGTYFAVDASYSAQDTYSKPDAQGQKYMYLCCVLTGDYTTGAGNMIVPPHKPSSTMHYDSVVNNMQNMCMFVIFQDNHAYPEYLITFK